MTFKDGDPCRKCGTNERYKNGNCRKCALNYYYENQGKQRERMIQWGRDNPERKRENKRRWVENNREKTREWSREWRRNNPDKKAAAKQRYRTRKTKAGGSYTAEEFKALCKQYNNRCACCGKKKKLEFDHVVPVSKGGSSDISNGQPLCRTCNVRKMNKTTDYRTKPGILRWIQRKLL